MDTIVRDWLQCKMLLWTTFCCWEETLVGLNVISSEKAVIEYSVLITGVHSLNASFSWCFSPTLWVHHGSQVGANLPCNLITLFPLLWDGIMLRIKGSSAPTSCRSLFGDLKEPTRCPSHQGSLWNFTWLEGWVWSQQTPGILSSSRRLWGICQDSPDPCDTHIVESGHSEPCPNLWHVT